LALSTTTDRLDTANAHNHAGEAAALVGISAAGPHAGRSVENARQAVAVQRQIGHHLDLARALALLDEARAAAEREREGDDLAG
jgi:hypothetical protein